MDTELQEYREYLIEKHNAEFPKFAKDAVHTAPVLALLQDPGNSGAEVRRVCSIENPDQYIFVIVTEIDIEARTYHRHIRRDGPVEAPGFHLVPRQWRGLVVE